jgi:hypothetical protein
MTAASFGGLKPTLRDWGFGVVRVAVTATLPAWFWPPRYMSIGLYERSLDDPWNLPRHSPAAIAWLKFVRNRG